jgi:hypothetical protein
MKSFVAYPLEFEKCLFPQANNKAVGKLIAHYELYKKVSQFNGSIVKCGITPEEGFSRFAMFKSLVANHANQKMIAFEKFSRTLYYENTAAKKGQLQYKINSSATTLNYIQNSLVEKGITEKVDFVPGSIHDAIPNYLIENPELKIAFLNIDLDDYDTTLCALEFFYPRLMEGGILVFDNYYKLEEEYRAVYTYFASSNVVINNFSVNRGPHYIIKNY